MDAEALALRTESPRSPTEPLPRARFSVVVLGALAVVLSILRYGPTVSAPWGESAWGFIPPVYYRSIEHNYQRHGFWELRGAPYLTRLPMTAGAVPPQLASVMYLRHPVLTFWLVHLGVEIGGWSERTFRLVPIMFSSLSALFLVLLVTRVASASWAAVALGLYLVLPMSWFVGSMTGYEPFVLAAMLAAFWLHLRLRRASAGIHGLTWLLVAVAVQLDWVGAAVVPALVVYELTMPRSERRLARALGLLIPAAASGLVALLLMAYWRQSIGLMFSDVSDVVSWAVLPEAHRASLGEWLSAQAKFWRALFTLPVSLLAWAALPWLAFTCRSRTDSLPRLAVALFVPAVLNAVAFADHAFSHEFWWYYAVPYVVIAFTAVLRAVVRLPFRAARVCAALAFLAILAWAAVSTRDRYLADRTTRFKDQGLELNRLVGQDDLLVYPAALDRAGFWLRSWYCELPGELGLAEFQQMRALKQRGSLRVDRVVALVPDSRNRDLTEENTRDFQKAGMVGRIEPAALASQLPALAQAWPGQGFWVLIAR